MSELEQRMASWLAAVSQRTGVPLTLDEDGACGMDCGNGLEVGVALLDAERVGLFAAVAWLTDTNRAELQRTLLSRNLFSVHPQGAALGLDTDTDTAYLCQQLRAADLDALAFEDHLGTFILAARAMLEDLPSTRPAADAAAPAAMPWNLLRA